MRSANLGLSSLAFSALVATLVSACDDTPRVITTIGAFAPPINYAAGLYPSSVAVGDLNGDGRPDLAVAEKGESRVSVLLNSGRGTFAPAVDYAAGKTPLSLALGDLDRDQTLDLAVADLGSLDNLDQYAVSVLLNKGDGDQAGEGTFVAAVNYIAGTRPSSIAVGDLDRDDWLDLAIANYSDETVSVLRNEGGGTFEPSFVYQVGVFPSSVAVGDVDGDGKPDLVVANSGDGTVSVLLNITGDGASAIQLATAVSYSIGGSSASGGAFALALGDLNGDGRLDLAVANYSDDAVSVLLNVGHGTFVPGVNYAVGRVSSRSANPISVATGDLDGDGRLDLATANNGDGTVSVLLNNGEGTFAVAANYSVGGSSQSAPISVALADLDGDGRFDLAVANQESGDVTVLLNTGGLSTTGR